MIDAINDKNFICNTHKQIIDLTVLQGGCNGCTTSNYEYRDMIDLKAIQEKVLKQLDNSLIDTFDALFTIRHE